VEDQGGAVLVLTNRWLRGERGRHAVHLPELGK
jgi:hypothetical protein